MHGISRPYPAPLFTFLFYYGCTLNLVMFLFDFFYISYFDQLSVIMLSYVIAQEHLGTMAMASELIRYAILRPPPTMCKNGD